MNLNPGWRPVVLGLYFRTRGVDDSVGWVKDPWQPGAGAPGFHAGECKYRLGRPFVADDPATNYQRWEPRCRYKSRRALPNLRP